jgi:hypothetical protein
MFGLSIEGRYESMKNVIRWMSTLGVLAVLIGGVALNQALAVTENFKLTASDAELGDGFGISVSASGDVIIAGAWENLSHNLNAPGSAYIYRFDGIGWVEEAKLTADDGTADDNFGYSVSISGDVAVVGAFGEGILGQYNDEFSGAAYVYRFDGANWIQEAKLTANDFAMGDLFGSAVSISGDVIVVGAVGDDDAGSNSGAAYVYRFNGTDWKQEAKLVASDAAEGKDFGFSVSVSGEAAVVGARDDSHSGIGSGAVYVYQYNGTNWIETDKLTANDAASNDVFGDSVSLSGDVIVVGADSDDDAGLQSGSAYVFRFDGNHWIQEAKLLASDGAANDHFGRTVSVDGNIIVIGSTFDDDAGDYSGSAYLYWFNGNHWIQKAKLTASDADKQDAFGSSVSVSGKVIVVGAENDDDGGPESGAAYVYGSPCNEPEIVRGIIKDKKAPKKDAFSIKVNDLKGFGDSLVDLDTKTVTVQVGPLELDIPGERFITLRNGAYAYYSHSADSKQIYFFYFNPKNSSASLNGARTNLDKITNPITVKIGIDGHCWQSTTEWREVLYPRKVIYRYRPHPCKNIP